VRLALRLPQRIATGSCEGKAYPLRVWRARTERRSRVEAGRAPPRGWASGSEAAGKGVGQTAVPAKDETGGGGRLRGGHQGDQPRTTTRNSRQRSETRARFGQGTLPCDGISGPIRGLSQLSRTERSPSRIGYDGSGGCPPFNQLSRLTGRVKAYHNGSTEASVL